MFPAEDDIYCKSVSIFYKIQSARKISLHVYTFFSPDGGKIPTRKGLKQTLNQWTNSTRHAGFIHQHRYFLEVVFVV